MDNFGLWLTLGLVIAVIGAWAALRRVRANNAKVFQAELTPERAADASRRLTAEQHREVYRCLATNNVLGAAQAVRTATGQTARDCLLDVQALAKFPQVSEQGGQTPLEDPWSSETGAGQATSTGDAGANEVGPSEPSAQEGPNAPKGRSMSDSSNSDEAPNRSSDTPHRHDGSMVPSAEGVPADEGASGAGPSATDDDEWVIPDDWEETYGGELGGERHMEFTHHDGEKLRRFSTQDLPDAERDQLMSQLRDGDVAEAAKLISEKIGLRQEEIEMALRANHESGHDGVDGIAVRFNREDGETVEFSTQDLPEAERDEFIMALRAGDLDVASLLVARHTGLSQEQAKGMLKAFRPPQ